MLLKFEKTFTRDAFNVIIDYEYTLELEKKITSLLFYVPKTGKCLRVDWKVIEPYLRGKERSLYIREDGLSIKVIANKLVISDSRFTKIIIYPNEMELILRAVEDIKRSVSE
ncbi:MAG TPA: hypothetical protein ENG50_02735, partial [Candidatus Altiarchaeales archaeon]|nr:hypothetical protein [Candidatus Altiarchaeales archaeon]